MAVSCCALDDGSAPILPAEICTFCASIAVCTSGWHPAARRGQFRWIHPDTHRVFCAENAQAADAISARQRVLHVTDQPVGDIGAGGFVIFIVHREDQRKLLLRFHYRDAGLLHLARQTRFRLLDLVLYLHLGGIRVGPLLEGDGNIYRAVRLLVEVK